MRMIPRNLSQLSISAVLRSSTFLAYDHCKLFETVTAHHECEKFHKCPTKNAAGKFISYALCCVLVFLSISRVGWGIHPAHTYQLIGLIKQTNNDDNQMIKYQFDLSYEQKFVRFIRILSILRDTDFIRVWEGIQ